MAVDGIIMKAWAEAWAISRGAMTPVKRDGALYTHVGEPDHVGRYLFTQLKRNEIASLVARIDRPDIYIKVCTNAESLSSILPPTWFVAPPHCMMTVELPKMLNRRAPVRKEPLVSLERRQGAIFATVRDRREQEIA